jgi:hypothetical protein
MSEATEIAVLITDPQEAAGFGAEIEALTGEQPLVVHRRGIDGATTAGLLVIATTAVQTLPAVLDSLARLLRRNAVSEIELTEHGIRIVNPRAEDIADLRARIGGTSSGGPADA